MSSDREPNHRKSMRLPGYDYAQNGIYFVTLCTHQRQCLFGEISDGALLNSPAGLMVREMWETLPERFPFVTMDAFILMPNHLHGLLYLTQTPTGRGEPTPTGRDEPCVRPDEEGRNTPEGRTQGSSLPVGVLGYSHPTGTGENTIGRIVQAFKSLTTYHYTQGVKQSGWSPFDSKVWQRNYHDHIVRDESTLQNIRNYIVTNPARWGQDEENPGIMDSGRNV